MSDPTPVNSAADVVNGIIKAINSGGVTAAEAFVTALDPELLGNPIVAYFLDKGIEWLADLIQQIEIRDATAIVIDIQTNGEQSAVIQAGAALAFANASGDKNAIEKAKQNLIGAYGSLIHFDGIAN